MFKMGTPITEEKGLCRCIKQLKTFVSTKTIKDDYSKPFCFLMDFQSMLGVGVGFDTKGAR